MLDELTRFVRDYTRIVLTQSVGLIGLAWCLSEGRAGFAVALTALVLIDQAVFLRGRARDAAPRASRNGLGAWRAALGGLDLLLCCAAIMRRAGLREGVGGPPADGPLDCLGFVLASFAHGPTALVAATAGGRLLGAVLAGGGAVAFVTVLAAALAAALGGRRAG